MPAFFDLDGAFLAGTAGSLPESVEAKAEIFAERNQEREENSAFDLRRGRSQVSRGGMDGGLDARADARGSAMDAPIGARVSAKGAGALSAVRGRIAQVKLRITAASSVLIAAAMCGMPARAQEKRPTAQEVIAAIQEHVGGPWRAQTVDTFKAGNPETRVTGIAVTVMATLDVLQRAAANGQNLIITHEPTFFNHYDDKPEGMDENDAVWNEKRAFIENHG